MKKHSDVDNLLDKIKMDMDCVPALRPPFPDNMLIELTNACNNKCVFCAHRLMSRKIGEIKSELLERILKEACDLGVRRVGFYATGEPFLSEKLSEYVRMAKELGFEYVYITTNGILATPSRVVPVVESGLDSIKFSINAGTPHTYRKLHGSDGFKKIYQNVRFISEYRKKNKKAFRIFASYVVTKDNEAERGLFSDLFKPFTDDILFLGVGNQGGVMAELNRASVSKNFPDEFRAKPPCDVIFNRLNVTCEGYLTICCVDFDNYLAVADLNEVSLREAWHCDAFVEIRDRHIKNELRGTQCYSCINDEAAKFKPLSPQFASIRQAEKKENRPDQ